MAKQLGRKRKWRPRFTEEKLNLAVKMAEHNLTDQQIAEILDVSISVFGYWKRTNPGFLNALKTAKERADLEVKVAIQKRILGFTHTRVEVINDPKKGITHKTIEEYFPPDTAAGFKWLALRDPQNWTEVHKAEITKNINIRNIDMKNVSTEDLQMIEKMQLQYMIENTGTN